MMLSVCLSVCVFVPSFSSQKRSRALPRLGRINRLPNLESLNFQHYVKGVSQESAQFHFHINRFSFGPGGRRAVISRKNIKRTENVTDLKIPEFIHLHGRPLLSVSMHVKIPVVLGSFISSAATSLPSLIEMQALV